MALRWARDRDRAKQNPCVKEEVALDWITSTVDVLTNLRINHIASRRCRTNVCNAEPTSEPTYVEKRQTEVTAHWKSRSLLLFTFGMQCSNALSSESEVNKTGWNNVFKVGPIFKPVPGQCFPSWPWLLLPENVYRKTVPGPSVIFRFL